MNKQMSTNYTQGLFYGSLGAAGSEYDLQVYGGSDYLNSGFIIGNSATSGLKISKKTDNNAYLDLTGSSANTLNFRSTVDGSNFSNVLQVGNNGNIRAFAYGATGLAADSETLAVAALDPSGNLVRDFAFNARIRNIETLVNNLDANAFNTVPSKVNEIIHKLNNLNFYSAASRIMDLSTNAPANITPTS